MFQSGSGARLRRFPCALRTLETEFASGKSDQAMDRDLPERTQADANIRLMFSTIDVKVVSCRVVIRCFNIGLRALAQIGILK